MTVTLFLLGGWIFHKILEPITHNITFRNRRYSRAGNDMMATIRKSQSPFQPLDSDLYIYRSLNYQLKVEAV